MSEKEKLFNNLLKQLVEKYGISTEDEAKNLLKEKELYIDVFTK